MIRGRAWYFYVMADRHKWALEKLHSPGDEVRLQNNNDRAAKKEWSLTSEFLVRIAD